MKKVNDIMDNKKTYARERFREWFYEFDTLTECERHISAKRLTPYAFYDGIKIYSGSEVAKILTLREQGKENEIRY